MRLPKLNRKFVLETPERLPDGAGGYEITWVPLGELWAEVKSGQGRELEVHSLPRSQVPLVVTVRAAPMGSDARPRAGQRFREGTRIYNINAVTEASDNLSFLMVRVMEEVAA